jgi:hypothetical protein
LHHDYAEPSLLQHEPIVTSIANTHGRLWPEALNILKLAPILIHRRQNRQVTRHSNQLGARFAEGIRGQDVDL